MKLQTEISLDPQENQINYTSQILLLGSCFAENIGKKFDYYKFQNLQNPFGVIFNPISIENLIIRALEDKPFIKSDIFQTNGIWKCFEVHSQFSALDTDNLLERLNSALKLLKEALFSSSHIIFTLGTSWVYKHIDSNHIVANCHRIPQKNFKKELLPIEIISKSIKNTIEKIRAVNPKASVIFTVSPVRHIKDGFVENTVSKAHLFAAIHSFLKHGTSTINSNCTYFHSYEIMMDELRDYRFYSEDMLHPNKTAIEVIWQKFSDAWIASETQSIQKEIANIQNGLLHKPFHPESPEHRDFIKELQLKKDRIQKIFPHIKF